MTLEEQVKVVAQARQNLASFRAVKDRLYVAWLQEHHVLIEELDHAQAAKDKAEADLREAVLAEYKEMGTTKPAPGVEVKLFQVLDYPEKEATAWGIKTGLAIKLDKPAFEKIARVSPMDFVVIRMEPRCQIATDLDKVLKE